MRLVFSIFLLPFWVFLAAAGGLFYLGELAHRDTLAKNQELSRALAGNPPATVDLADFSRAENMGLADEVSVRGVINPDYNYELTKQRKGADKTRFMFVLFDAADPQGSKMARGALVLTENEKDAFVNDYYFENSSVAVTETDAVSVITLNGLSEGSPDLSSMVRDVFEEQNLTKSENFIYIEPFLKGREVGLTPTTTADEMRNIIRGVGLVAALIGLVKFALRRRKKAAQANESYDESPATSSAGAHFVPTAPVGGHDTGPAAPDAGMMQEEAVPSKRRLPVKALAVVALIAATAYSGHFAYLAVALVIAAYMFIARKTGKAVKSGIGRLGTALPGSKNSDAAILDRVKKDAGISADAKTTVAMSLDAACETAPESDTDLPLAGLEGIEPRSGFKLPFPNRDNQVAPDPVIEGVSDDETGRKWFGMRLPGLKNHEEEPVPAELTPRTPIKRKKEAFQAPVLFASGGADETHSIGAKAQLLLARLKPAGGAPRALSGRPDPFERLASEARGNAAR